MSFKPAQRIQSNISQRTGLILSVGPATPYGFAEHVQLLEVEWDPSKDGTYQPRKSHIFSDDATLLTEEVADDEQEKP